MQTVVLSGTDHVLARRVAARIADPGRSDPATVLSVDATAPDLKRLVDGADALVFVGGPVETAAVLLDAAGAAHITRVVVVSSATAYGAWPNNPVPLTEDAPLRPNPDFEPGWRAAEIERLAAEWREGHPGSTVAVLRPTVTVGDDFESELSRGLRAAARLRAAEEEPPGQFVHIDDVAAAIDIAWRTGIDGPRNVAPDGWISGEDVRALAGGPRLRVPERVAVALSTLRWRLGLAPTPPGLLPYAAHPWVIANDRMRAAGWAPTHTNEEAFVVGHRPSPLAAISPQRRQELALGGAVVGAVGLTAGVVAAVRAMRRRAGRRA